MATQSRRRNTRQQQQDSIETTTTTTTTTTGSSTTISNDLMQQPPRPLTSQNYPHSQFRRIHHNSKRYRQNEERKLKWTLFAFATFVMGTTGYILYALIWHGSSSLADALPFSSSSSLGNSKSKYLYASMNPQDSYPVQELLHPDYVTNVSSPLPLTEDVDHPSFLYPPPKKEEKDDETNVASSSSSLANRHRIVEFYAPWCPHCQHFKKKYIQFARNLHQAVYDVQGDDIDVYAVSCVPHKTICRDLDVHSYPTLKLYKAGSYNSTDLKQTKLHPLHVFHELGMEYHHHSKHTTKEDDDDDDMTAITTSGGGGDEQHGGTPTTANQRNNNLRTAHSSSTAKTTTTTKRQIYNDATVSFEFAMKNSMFTQRGESLDPHQIKIFHKWLEVLDKSLPPTTMMTSLQEKVTTLLTHKHEIVENEHTLLSYLGVSPNNKTKGAAATTDKEEDEYSWSPACSHVNDDTNNNKEDNDGSSGYTCGLWQLFHILSMGVVEWGVLVTDEYQTIPTMEAADLIRNYIDHYFGCEECRTNFLHEYDACAFRRCERLSTNHTKSRIELRQLPLWLWETHNAINVRLNHERMERETKKNKKKKNNNKGGSTTEEQRVTTTTTTFEDQNVLWPHRRDCPTCWNWDGTYNEESVYQYLRVHYWPTDEISRKYKQELWPGRSKYKKRSAILLFGSSSTWMTFLPCGALLFGGAWWWYLKKRRRGIHRPS